MPSLSGAERLSCAPVDNERSLSEVKLRKGNPLPLLYCVELSLTAVLCGLRTRCASSSCDILMELPIQSAMA